MSNNKVDYTQKDLFQFYLNKILLDWIKNNHPKIIEKAQDFLINELQK